MKILHLASANRWTGAAAPALADVESLRSRGMDAYYAYIGGYRLEDKLRCSDFAFPLIEKKQNPLALRRSLQALSGLVEQNGIEIVHAHLTYDHLLAALLARRVPSLRVVRTFHARRALRRDRFLLRSTAGVCVINETFLRHFPSSRALFTPPPVDHRQFNPRGPTARQRLGIADGTAVVGVIGKLSPGRGFEEALETFAIVVRSRPDVRLVIIGHGPHRAALEARARTFNVEPKVIWAGYHEEDLPEYLRALDVMFFTRPGSDEGHRAVTEAMACGVPVACYPLPGVEPLLGALDRRLRAAKMNPADLAALALSVLGRNLANECVQATMPSSFAAAAQRLLTLYQQVLIPSG